MLIKIYQSTFSKHVALLLAVSTLCMSFNIKQDDIILSAGTSVSLETISSINSDLAAPGQIVDFKVRHDVKVDDKVVIPAGSIAKGQILRAQKAKGLGKEGFLEIQLKSVKAIDGQDIVLTNGNFNQHGEDKETLSIVLGVLVCLLFLTMKGKNAEIPAGYETSAVVATSVTIKL